jgi:hypothetical protein
MPKIERSTKIDEKISILGFFFGIWKIWPISLQMSVLYVKTVRYLFKSEIVLIVSSCATLLEGPFKSKANQDCIICPPFIITVICCVFFLPKTKLESSSSFSNSHSGLISKTNLIRQRRRRCPLNASRGQPASQESERSKGPATEFVKLSYSNNSCLQH